MENSEFFLPESTPPYRRRRTRNTNNSLPVGGNLPRTPLFNFGQYGEESVEVPYDIPVFNLPINTPTVPSVTQQSPNYRFPFGEEEYYDSTINLPPIDITANLSSRNRRFRSRISPKEEDITPAFSNGSSGYEDDISELIYENPLDPNAPFEEDYNALRRSLFYSALNNPIKEKEKKEPTYSPQDWIITGLMGANAITGKQSALRQEQNQANLMREMGQRPTYYAGYYDNAARTTIGRNQGLITASHGALIPSTETGLENALVERGEYLVYPDGKFREVGGEKHSAKVVNGKEVGGTETILPEGTMVFSQKLNVPGTKKSFANMAKSLSGKIEDYMEKMNKVGIAKVDKDTAELMFNRTVKSLNELFELQQSVNGNHGEDYVDTVDPDTGEGGEMPIAENGMIKYQDGGTPTATTTPAKPQTTKSSKLKNPVPPKGYLEIYDRAFKETNQDVRANFLDILRRQKIDVSNNQETRAAIEKADKINTVLRNLNDYYFNIVGEQPQLSPGMDRKAGDAKRRDIINEYLQSENFKRLGIKPDELGIFASNTIQINSNGTYSVKDNIKTATDLFDKKGVEKFQSIYRGMFDFTKMYQANDNYKFDMAPIGLPDQRYQGAPISPIDGWFGNTTVGQIGKPVQVYPEYEEPQSKEPPPAQTGPGSNFEKPIPVRPSKYTGRPYDIKQAIPNVLAMSQEIAPYVIPEVQDIRVSPYETYIDPAVQDQYSAAMAASSYGADPNAMFINATGNVMKMQAEKRNQDANIDYQTRMQNANFERQADMLNANSLGQVNNNLLNVAKSNKAALDINSMQNMIENYAKYQQGELTTAMKFPLVSPSADFNANTLEYTVIPEYQEARMNVSPTLFNQEGFFIPDGTQLSTATKKEPKKENNTNLQVELDRVRRENAQLRALNSNSTK